ncbi:hypothetical protein AMR41_14600 [Hapalosiphon sp. MRB220]|nr:hypothetical protein AMR41_14600 [Hapalosiphon sp. MRB220]
MVLRKFRLLVICLALMLGLLSACTVQQSEKSPQSSNTSTVEPLTQLSPIPISPNTVDLQSPETLGNTSGQTIYVPAYSHVYYGNGKEYLLATTLSIRNTSLTDTILVTSVSYYDSKGKLVKEYSQKGLQLPPMATTEFFVEEKDTSGGSGANFLVKWTAQKNVTEPVVEAVMISTAFQQGISFISPGRVIENKSK